MRRSFVIKILLNSFASLPKALVENLKKEKPTHIEYKNIIQNSYNILRNIKDIQWTLYFKAG